MDLTEEEGTPGGADVFIARPPGSNFLFGGLVAALSLRSAQFTVEPTLHAHSVHSHFLASGEWGRPIRLEVERTRDGKSFATRRVRATQGDRLLATITASFHAGEEGPDWQPPCAVPASDPDGLLDFDHQLGFVGYPLIDIRPVDQRYVSGEVPRYVTPIHPYWARVTMDLPDDPAIHACGLVFLSDFMVVTSSLPPGEQRPPNSRSVTIDHTIWLHRPSASDDWHLFEAEPTTTGRSRTMIRGAITSRTGALVATFSQETVTRPVDAGRTWTTR